MADATPKSPAFDAEATAEALRALGMLYGAKDAFVALARSAASEEEAIRAYVQRERPHLLKTYDLETLVRLVNEARVSKAGAAPGVERFSPQ